MTITNITQAQAAAGLLFADGNRWAGNTITFSVPGVGATWGGYAEYGYKEPGQSTYSTFSQAQGDAFRAAIATWDSYIASSIREVADTTPGDLRIAFTDVSGGGAAGYAYIPARPGERAYPTYGDIWIDDGYKSSAFGRGSFDYEMLLHEAGHALGLKHTFEDTPLPAPYENTTYSVMSYTRTELRYTFNKTDNGGVSSKSDWVYATTPMVADILAIQKLYGADTATGAGNTVYAITDATAEHRQSIYDTGGIDTLDLTALSRGSTVDLRQGAYSDLDFYSVDQQVADAVAQFGSWAESYFRQVLSNPDYKAYTFSNNLGIAFSTIIENVRGSAKADDITGNEAANLLDGRGGADSLRGLTGNDIYLVDNAADRVFEAANAGTDTVKTSVSYVLAAGQSIEVLAAAVPAGTTALNLTGNELAQTLQGNAGANVLNGGAGADALYGFAGNDTYIVDNAGDRVFEAANAGTDTVKASVSYVLAAGQSIEVLAAAVPAGTTALNLTGNELAQTLQGNAGANVLNGGAGADNLYGFAGNDTYIVDDMNDEVYEAAGGGIDDVRAAVSYALTAGQAIEKLSTLSAAGTAAIDLTGNELGQRIEGNAGDNAIDGGEGADVLLGFGGDDTYWVDNAADRVAEAAGGGDDKVFAAVSYALAAGQAIEFLGADDADATVALNLTGNEFAQLLQGNAGVNVLNGGAGADQLYGFAGNDSYIVDNAGDQVFEGAGGGNDSVRADVSYALAAGQSIETLSAATGTGAINLTGNELAQTLVGNAGVNVLDGGAGADTLYGQGGTDSFVFKTAPVTIDRIGDFSAVDDTVVLARSIFTALSVGQLSDAAFKNVAVAGIDADDRILYDARSGVLSYDADGNGSAKAVTFAILANKPTDVSALDFLIA